MELAVAEVSPLNPPALPTTVMTPLVLEEPPTTILVLEIAQPEMADAASMPGALCSDSVTDVRQDEAAKMTSDTRARTV